METKQPQFTPRMRDNLNKMHHLLRERFYTKQELMDIFQVGERQIRMMITEVSHKLPVISTSGTNDGYKIARTIADLELVEHTWAELSSRMEELAKRIEPLKRFRDKAKYGINS